MVRVEVAYSPQPRTVDVVVVSLAPGATVGDALAASALVARHGVALDGLRLSVWGRRCAACRMLREGDRVECCRPLSVDPKQARRLRSSAPRSARPKAKRPAQAGR
jgi:putative ubiquitin-RnfH superfamily antitoxin RatB of RatAB toxin-antitoxin module